MPTIVKHVDKKSGTTRVYESTSHYDPVTKQSRPKRKYLGTLDPETGELNQAAARAGLLHAKMFPLPMMPPNWRNRSRGCRRRLPVKTRKSFR